MICTTVSQRRLTEQRKRRERREAYERAEREFVVGGPLVDHAEPVITAGSGAWHAERVKEVLAERATRTTREAEPLAEHFARRCWITSAAMVVMLIEYGQIMLSAGPARIAPTHSTAPDLYISTIPKLEPDGY